MGVMLLAISDKPKVFALLPPDILNSDHFRVSFETVGTPKSVHRACINSNSFNNHYLTNQLIFSVIKWSVGAPMPSTSNQFLKF
jgi:hypothetical protein